MSAYAEASRAVFEVFDDTTPLVEGLSIDEAFLDVGGLRRVSGTPTEIAVRLRREVLERVGLPITVGVARTKFLAKVASAVAKPDGLLVVPPDARARLPAPAAGRTAVGRRADHRRASSTRAASTRSARSRCSARRCSSSLLGRASGRHLHALAHNRDPRPGAGRPAAGVDRVAARARAGPQDVRRDRRVPRGPRRPGHPPAAQGRAHVPHRSCCASGSTTSPAPPGRTRFPARPRRLRSILAAARGSARRGASDHRAARDHARRHRARQPRRRRRAAARAAVRPRRDGSARRSRSTTCASGSARRR